MAAEASWQARSAETLGGTVPPSAARRDQRTVEGLLRRLVERVEESERHYGEALEELHARLDRLSQPAEPAPATDSSEETETLERLRSQLSSLARRLDHPEEMAPSLDDLAKLGRAWSEARDMSAGLTEKQGQFASPLFPAPTPFVPAAPALSFALPGETPSYATPSFELPPFGTEYSNLDKRLIDMAQRLEHSIGEAMPAAAIETLNTRMEEIARRFEAALERSPKLENLQHLERQITEMGQQLGGVEQQVARIAVIEGQLHRLIERLEDGPAQMEQVATKAANEAVRRVSDTGLGKPSAAERLDTIHRDIVAMNERGRATDDRLVDTLAAMHESLRDFVHQVERGRQPLPAPALASPQPRSEPAPSTETPNGKAITRDGAEDVRASYRSLRSLLDATADDFGNIEPAPTFGRAKRGPLVEEAVNLDESEPSRSDDVFSPETSLGPRDNLVAAARRAAQSAAARAEERRALRPRQNRDTAKTSAESGVDLPERRERSVLMIVAVLLLLVSAALLYSRLPSRPEAEAVLPATGQSAPAPAAEATPTPQAAPATAPAPPPAVEAAPDSTTGAAPAPDPSPVPDAAPAPEAAPDTATGSAPAPNLSPAPEVAPAPAAQPAPPHATTPSAETGNGELPPPVRVSHAPTVTAVADDAALGGGVTEMAKPSAAQAEITPKPQLASLRSDGAAMLPGISVTIAEAPNAGAAGATAMRSTLPMPGAELGPLDLREAAANGDARAEYAIALRYAQGQGSAIALAPNWTEAARWFALAASAGLAPAQYRLAVLYERGDGVAKDFGRAKSWYAAAAERGNVKAMRNLAVAATRESANADFALAAKWYAEAASYGLADSQFNLGVFAEHGLGMPKNPAEAYKWFSLAAASRDPEAIKRRDLIRLSLPAADLAAADQAVKNWRAKPAIAEANEVPEQGSWRAEGEAPNKALVARAQALLDKLGYDIGAADGEAGARTREAIKAFELRNGMDETGEVTVPLVTKLERPAG